MTSDSKGHKQAVRTRFCTLLPLFRGTPKKTELAAVPAGLRCVLADKEHGKLSTFVIPNLPEAWRAWRCVLCGRERAAGRLLISLLGQGQQARETMVQVLCRNRIPAITNRES